MKTNQFAIILTVLCGFLAGLSGCTPEFDEPAVKEYKYEKAATLTIAEFKSKYNTDFAQITAPVILKGVVNATDETGNIYKRLYLQDETGGIEISIDASNLYTKYRVGQEIFIECQDLYVGKYSGVLQIGYPYLKNGVETIGRMPEIVAKSHIFLNGTPDKNVTPTVVNSISELTESMLDKVITIKGIFFTNGGKESFASKTKTTSQEFTDSKGIKGIIYTSNYATFAQNILPKGLGTITAILSSYNGTWQLIIRDKNDIGTFDPSVTEPPKPPVYTGNANKTIAELKAQFTADLTEITDDIVIKGVVTSSDETGNIYKKFYIQDETGAISIAVNAKELYKTYQPGQEVFVECKGLYVGTYGGVLQIGQKYINTKTNVTQIGQMTDAQARTHIFFKQDPGALVTPIVTDIASITPDMQDKLITIKNVTFTNGGKNSYAADKVNTSEELKDANGNSIIVYTSGYATFASTILPTGPVTITAILSQFKGTWQLLIIDTKDVVKNS
jgi:hypothetical protein